MTEQPNKVEKFTRVFTNEGLIDLHIENRADASTVANHWNAIKDYLYTGESWKLETFEDVCIQVRDKKYKLNVRRDEIEDLYDVGELSFDDIYEFIY